MTTTVKLCYCGPGDNRQSVYTDFFLLPPGSLLIPMYGNTVRTDSDIMDFHLLQTSFPVPAIQRTSYTLLMTRLLARRNALCNLGQMRSDCVLAMTVRCEMRGRLQLHRQVSHLQSAPSLPHPHPTFIVCPCMYSLEAAAGC